MEKREPSYTVMGMWIGATIMEKRSKFLKKTRSRTSSLSKTKNDPAIPLLGIDSEKTMTPKDTSTSMFITGLCTITRTWKQPKCSLTEGWIKKICELPDVQAGFRKGRGTRDQIANIRWIIEKDLFLLY